VGYHKLPLEIDGVVVESSKESQEAILAGDQEAGVSSLTVHPGAEGDAGHAAARRNNHPEMEGRRRGGLT